MQLIDKMGILIFALIPILLFYGYLIVKKKIHIWFPSYIWWSIKNKKEVSKKTSMKPTHVMFLVADHFEPGPNTEIVNKWAKGYPKIAERHRDADGRPIRHTWFYPSEHSEERIEQLVMLAELASKGFGEIELHLHHRNDTEETLREKLWHAKSVFNKIGALITIDDKITFGFVHGDWALDNSVRVDGEDRCGVNNELIVLKDEGCYADFTFPAINTSAQPKMLNSIYYAKDDPLKPKSYNRGIDVGVNTPQSNGDLMIIQGPLTIDLRNWKRIFYPAIENAGIEGSRYPSIFRVDDWIRANVHVKGKPDWIFVKTHTHGAAQSSMQMFLGNPMDKLHSYLESKYNDGKEYCLHYVTAREAYNIIKAAEAGMDGNPNEYRDYLINPYKTSGI
jgi:hypothetical protein